MRYSLIGNVGRNGFIPQTCHLSISTVTMTEHFNNTHIYTSIQLILIIYGFHIYKFTCMLKFILTPNQYSVLLQSLADLQSNEKFESPTCFQVGLSKGGHVHYLVSFSSQAINKCPFAILRDGLLID